MHTALDTRPTPAGDLVARLPLDRDGLLAKALLVVAGSLLLALCAQIRFYLPGTPVPVTMQSFGVLVIGGALGMRLGVSAVALYLAYGLVGLPVFAGGALGLAAFSGATGGYLAGFLIAALFCGFATDRGWTRTLTGSVLVMIHATALIFIPGVAWLATLTGGIESALALGLWAYLPGAAIKIVLAAAFLPTAWRLVGRSSELC
ncbi:MAG: biotin transporter BioY [Phycisphaerales bacterium]